MKRVIIASAIVLMVVALGITFADKPTDEDGNYNGNGSPSGPHYNLLLLGKSKEMPNPKDNGNVIFINENGPSTIKLTEGPYDVLDGNATDKDGALFQLPNPDPDNDGKTEYSVFVRVLGPAGSIDITPEGYDGTDWIPSELTLTLTRTKSEAPKFINASKELLYIWVDIDDDGKLEHINLFSDAFQDYLWYIDNDGIKVVQMRFYEIETTVPDEIEP